MKYKSVRGTRDIYGKEVGLFSFIERKARDIFARYGYNEIRTPVFEETSLFTRSIGETTDIISKEMYSFKDRKGRDLTLRPEGTAPVVRSFIEHRLDLVPGMDRLFYIGPMFRYERPQAGRYREFWQIGAEFFSHEKHYSSIEIITLALDILRETGIKDSKLYLNNLGCPECRKDFVQALTKFAGEQKDNLCRDCQTRLKKNPLRILDCKNAECAKILEKSPKINEFWDTTCKDQFNELKQDLNKSGIEFIEDNNLVRGLDYYNCFVFEIKSSSLGAQDAVLAGGRYDSLVKELGGLDIPAVGFALGLERLASLVPGQSAPDITDNSGTLYLATAGDNLQSESMKTAGLLRAIGLRVICNNKNQSLKAALRQANNLNVRFVLILGANEVRQGSLTVKDLRENTQKLIKTGDLPDYLKGGVNA